KRTLDLLESRSDVARKWRRGKIDDEFLAEVEGGDLGKREVCKRQTLVLFVETPIDFALIPLIVKRETGFHQCSEVPSNRLGRNKMVLGQVQDGRPPGRFNLFQDRPLPDQLRVSTHCSPSRPAMGGAS